MSSSPVSGLVSVVGCSRASEDPIVANLTAAEKIRTALVGEAGAAGSDTAATGTGWQAFSAVSNRCQLSRITSGQTPLVM